MRGVLIKTLTNFAKKEKIPVHMKVYLGTDHAVFELKEAVKKFLQEKGYEVEDCGAYEFDKSDDYTQFITPVAEKINANPEDKGIIFGGSGQGEAMLANKFPKVRAVVFYGPHKPVSAIDASGETSEDPYAIISLSRKHNNANILSFGARFVTEEEVLKAVEIWLTTEFSGVERHQRRIEKVIEIAEHI